MNIARRIRRASFAAVLSSILVVLAACSDGKSTGNFTLPEGSPAAGKQAFLSLGCNSCHSLPEVAKAANSGSELNVQLGGEVRNIKTYGELVTAIVNPSHKILHGFAPQHKSAGGQSAMRNYNDVMTVTQLIDLVSYLQTQYHLRDFERSQYRAYFPKK